MDPRAPRHLAARILSIMFTVSFLLVVAAEIVGVLMNGTELTETASTLMLGVGSLLVGLNASFLARYLYAPPPLYSLQTIVGIMLSVALGGMVLLIAIGLFAAQFIPDAVGPISVNTLNVLTVIFTGIIGSLAGYLGFRPPEPANKFNRT